MKYSPNDFIICSDFDDTINDLVKCWIIWLNNKYGTNVTYEDIKSWDMSLAFTTLTVDQICEPLKDREFWKTVTMKPDAVYWIRKLISEGFQFYIVTASYHTTIQAKIEECLLRHFPEFDCHNLMTTYRKDLIKCNMLIDDYLPNLIGTDAVKVVMTANHNKNNHDIADFRVETWEGIYKLVHELYNIQAGEHNEHINNWLR